MAHSQSQPPAAATPHSYPSAAVAVEARLRLADHGLLPPFLQRATTYSAGDQMEQCTRLLGGDRSMLIYSGMAPDRHG